MFSCWKIINYLLKKNQSLLLNIGNSRGYSNYEIVNFVKKKIKSKTIIKFAKNRRGDVSSLVCNSDKLAKYFPGNLPIQILKKFFKMK